jgi:hypothetical protein
MNLRTLSLVIIFTTSPSAAASQDWQKNKTSFIPKLSQPLSGVTSDGVSAAEADAADFELPK